MRLTHVVTVLPLLLDHLLVLGYHATMGAVIAGSYYARTAGA